MHELAGTSPVASRVAVTNSTSSLDLIGRWVAAVDLGDRRAVVTSVGVQATILE